MRSIEQLLLDLDMSELRLFRRPLSAAQISHSEFGHAGIEEAVSSTRPALAHLPQVAQAKMEGHGALERTRYQRACVEGDCRCSLRSERQTAGRYHALASPAGLDRVLRGFQGANEHASYQSTTAPVTCVTLHRWLRSPVLTELTNGRWKEGRQQRAHLQREESGLGEGS